MRNKNTTQAIHKLIEIVDERMKKKLTTYVFFSDITAAFDKLKFNKIEQKLRENNFPNIFTNWFCNLNKNRILHITYGDAQITVKGGRGSGQGSVLSPYIWCCYANSLVEKLNNLNDIRAIFYADDFAVISKSLTEYASERAMKRVMEILKLWCRENGLNISLDKSGILRFTNKQNRNLRTVDIRYMGQRVEIVEEYMYLGIILDKKLSFKSHLIYVKKKLIQLSIRINNFVGKNWGFNLAISKWSYQCVALPKMSYGASIWAKSLEKKSNRDILHRAQNCVTRALSHTMRSTPSVSVQASLDLMPIVSDIRSLATREYIRLFNLKQLILNENNSYHRWAKDNLNLDMMCERSDTEIETFKPQFEVIINDRMEWLAGNVIQNPNHVNAFSDASVNAEENIISTGIVCHELNIRETQ